MKRLALAIVIALLVATVPALAERPLAEPRGDTDPLQADSEFAFDGTTYRATLEEMERMITDAGFTARRRRQDYSLIEEAAVAA